MTPEQKNFWLNVLNRALAPYWLINKCFHKMEIGCSKYGEFNPDRDRRNFYLEIEKELLDAINYGLMSKYRNDFDDEILESLIELTEKVRERRK